uniref:Uncharacterized protein n=1 Tax=Ciona savignyi TaxID=51511 RepID=H2ZBI0_CIOSA
MLTKSGRKPGYPTKDTSYKLSGDSRSSSYNSVKSSNSFDQAKTKQKVKPSLTLRTKPKLSKTQSVPNSEHMKPVSTSESNNRRNSNNSSTGFSMFNGQNMQDSAPLDVTSKMPSWNNFGQQNTFNLTDDLITLPNSTPLPHLRSSPPNWGSFNSIYESWSNMNMMNPPPGSPTTPKIPMTPWSQQSNPQQAPMTSSTHEIWAVRNAVTMDEDRESENDLLKGLKSIWNSDPSQSGRSNLF